MTSKHVTVGLQLEPGPRNGKQALTKSPDANQTFSFLLVNCLQALSDSHSAQYMSSAQSVAGTAQVPSDSTEGPFWGQSAFTKDTFSTLPISSNTSGICGSRFFSTTKPDCAFEETLFPSLYAAAAINVTT